MINYNKKLSEAKALKQSTLTFTKAFINYIKDHESGEIYVKNNTDSGCHQLPKFDHLQTTGLTIEDLQQIFTLPPNNLICIVKQGAYLESHLSKNYIKNYHPCVSIKYSSKKALTAILFYTNNTNTPMQYDISNKVANELGAVAGVVDNDMNIHSNYGWSLNLKNWNQCNSQVTTNSIAINLNALTNFKLHAYDSIHRHQDIAHIVANEDNTNTMNTNLIIQSQLMLNEQISINSPNSKLILANGGGLQAKSYQPLSIKPDNACSIAEVGKMIKTNTYSRIDSIKICTLNPICNYLTKSQACYLNPSKYKVQFIFQSHHPQSFYCPANTPTLISAISAAPLTYNYIDLGNGISFIAGASSTTQQGLDQVICGSYNMYFQIFNKR